VGRALSPSKLLQLNAPTLDTGAKKGKETLTLHVSTMNARKLDYLTTLYVRQRRTLITMWNKTVMARGRNLSEDGEENSKHLVS
jgi:hypothetical protein